MNTDAATIASSVRMEIARLKLNNAEVADRAGIKRSTFRRRVIGEIPFRADELMRVARALGVPNSTFTPDEPNGGEAA